MLNWGLVAWVQGSIWEGLGGFKILVKAFDLGRLGMLAWVLV